MVHFLHIMGFAWFGAAAVVLPPASEPAGEVCEAAHEAPVPARAASSGLKVVIDPETGKIVDRPTRAQLERLSEEFEPRERPAASELREFALEGGGQGVFLDGWADQSLAVEVPTEEELRATCTKGEAQDGGGETAEDETQ